MGYEDSKAKAIAGMAEAEAWERAQPEYIEAEAYVRAMKHEGFVFIGRLYDQLERGEMLTPQQVERVQLTRQADIREAERKYRRAETAAAKTADVLVWIPPHIKAGNYAVEVGRVLYHVVLERPTEGILRGFTRVTINFGEGKEVEGIQYPDPWQEQPGYRQWYRGPMPHIVKALIDNPVLLPEDDWRVA